MNILMIVLTVYMTYCVLAIRSQAQHDLSVNLTVSAIKAEYNFNGIMFDRFYHCLRNEDFAICHADGNNNHDVFSVRGCPQVENIRSGDGFTCTPTAGGLVCKRGDSSLDKQDTACLIGYSIDSNALLSQQVRMTWVGVETVAISSNRSDIMITNLPNSTYVIQKTIISTQLIPTSTSITKTISTAGKPQASPTSNSSITTLPHTGNPGTRGEANTDDGDDTGIIIGALIAVIVVLAVTLIIFIILSRCKKAPSSTAATNSTNNSDTSIYLNENDVKPDSNSRPEQTGPETLKHSYMNVCGDADEELKKIRKVSPNTNDASISQDSNQDTGLNANADSIYTEINTNPASNNVRGHYVNQNGYVNSRSNAISKSSMAGPGSAYYNYL